MVTWRNLHKREFLTLLKIKNLVKIWGNFWQLFPFMTDINKAHDVKNLQEEELNKLSAILIKYPVFKDDYHNWLKRRETIRRKADEIINGGSRFLLILF